MNKFFSKFINAAGLVAPVFLPLNIIVIVMFSDYGVLEGILAAWACFWCSVAGSLRLRGRYE